MKRRIGTVAIGLAALAALIAVPAAMAAYSSPKLDVTQIATGVVVKASLDPDGRFRSGHTFATATAAAGGEAVAA